MADSLQLDIVTPEKAVYSGVVSEVGLPGTLGEIGVLPGHRPLLTLLAGGTLSASGSGTSRVFAVGSGIAEISDDRVTVLVTRCDGADDIDVASAREHLAALEKEAETADFVTEDELAEHAAELARARARVSIVERATR